MKKTLILLSLILALTSCSGSPDVEEQTQTTAAVQVSPTAALADSLDSSGSTQESDNNSGLPADVETYYKTMVLIEGTAQLMKKFDLTALSGDSTGMLALIAIPGIMDDRVIATEETPLPAGLDSAWSKALEARDGILEAYEALLTTWLEEDYLKQLDASESLASQAVAETEVILVSAGSSEDSVALSNRAALTEMGEAYQTYVSMILVIESERDKNTE
jgi:hypothetical protein